MARHDQPNRLAPDCGCGKCGQRHVTRHGGPACAGHVTYDRATYVPGQNRAPLPEPRPCRSARPKAVDDQGWKCASHGGAARQVKAANQRRKQRAEAERLMATLGEPVLDADAGEIIAERIAARAGHVRWLLARVQDLEPEALTWGITKRKTAVNLDRPGDEQDDGHERRHFAGTDEGDTFEARPHIWFTLYTDAARDLERLCIDAIRVGLDERRVRIAESQADILVRVMDGVLAELGHNPNDPATADVVARHLRVVGE